MNFKDEWRVVRKIGLWGKRARGFIWLLLKHRTTARVHWELRGILKKCSNHIVWDVGAHDGEWSFHSHLLSPRGKFFLFEPNPSHQLAHSRLGFDSFEVLLLSKEEPVKFYSTGGTGDSVFKEKSSSYENLEGRDIMARTLENVMMEQNLSVPSVIKLDTQGSELEVLKGFESKLKEVRFLILELSLNAYNEGQPSMSEVISFLESQSFLPSKILGENMVGTVLAQIDVLFENQNIFTTRQS